MAKKKISLSNRKRLSELQEDEQTTQSVVRQEEIKLMQKEAEQDQKAQSLNQALLAMVDNITHELILSYKGWSQPLNENRYRYSPNERNKKLLHSIKSYLIEVADWLMAKGIYGQDCMVQCQYVADLISKALRSHEIPVGALQLRPSKSV